MIRRGALMCFSRPACAWTPESVIASVRACWRRGLRIGNAAQAVWRQRRITVWGTVAVGSPTRKFRTISGDLEAGATNKQLKSQMHFMSHVYASYVSAKWSGNGLAR
jgi:hypothetical protein